MKEQFRDEMVSILENSKSSQEERIQALFQLMNIADKQSLDSIFNCLKNDPCEIVRHEAAFVLGETAAHDAIDMLKYAVLNDSSEIVKHESLLALGTINNKEVIPFLEEIEKSSEKLISESAKIAIERINWKGDPYRGPKQFENLN